MQNITLQNFQKKTQGEIFVTLERQRFLDTTPKAQFIKKKKEKENLDFIKIKTALKGIVKKKKAIDDKKIFAPCTSDKGLTIYPEYMKNSQNLIIRKQTTQLKKWVDSSPKKAYWWEMHI